MLKWQASGVAETDAVLADSSASFGDIFVEAENNDDVSDELYRSIVTDDEASKDSTCSSGSTISTTTTTTTITSSSSNSSSKADEKGEEGEGGSAEKVGRLQSSSSNNSTNSNRLAFRPFPLRNSTNLNRMPPSLESKKHFQDVQAMFKPPQQHHFLTSTRYQRLTPSTFENLDSCDSERSEKELSDPNSKEDGSQEKVPTKEGLEPTRLFLGKDDFSTRPITRQCISLNEKPATAPPRQQRKRPSVEEETGGGTGHRAERKRSCAVRLNESIAVEPFDDEVFTSFVGDNNSTVVTSSVEKAPSPQQKLQHPDKDRETAATAAEEEKRSPRSLRSPSLSLSPSVCSPPQSSSFAGKPPCVMAQKLLRTPFVRAHSSGALEMGGSARAREEEDLPSFHEQTYRLPVLESFACKKFSMAYGSISAETLAHEIERLGDAFSDHFILIDCRYPYEYNGGHIKFAINMHSEEIMERHFWKEAETQRSPETAEKREGEQREEEKTKNRIPIFYCEYSQKRGPNIAVHLRSCDRQVHSLSYPFLEYPEIYLLDKGYRAFFHEFKDTKQHVLCEKCAYVEMHQSAELNLYRAHRRGKKQHTSKNQKRRAQHYQQQQQHGGRRARGSISMMQCSSSSSSSSDPSGAIDTTPGVKTRSVTAAPDTREKRAVRRQRRNLALVQKEKEVSPRSKSGDDGTEKEGSKSGTEEVDKGPRLPPMSSSDSEENNSKEEPEKRRSHPENTTSPFLPLPPLRVTRRALRLRLNLSSDESAPEMERQLE